MASYALGLPMTTLLTYLTLFWVGSFIMRGAACTINDMCDRDLDRGVGESPRNLPTHGRNPSRIPVLCLVLIVAGWILIVERTKTRPIASGKVTIPQAAEFLVLQSSAGLAILAQSNRYR